ncbi:MAG: histidine kinase [Chloroflexota bacterium]|nr:histidine kinase [Chloroflexota bacterium]
MVDKLREWLNPDPGTPGSFRVGFMAAYVWIVGGIVLYLNLISPCATGPRSGRFFAMLLMIAALPVVERFELARGHLLEPSRLGVVLLTMRMALVQGIVLLDCSGLAILLYPVIPFAAYFAIGPKAGLIFALFYWVLGSAGALFLDQAALLSDSTGITNSVIYTLAMIFMLSIARILRREEGSRQQMRQLLDRLATSHRQLEVYAIGAAELAAAEERNRLAREIHDSLGHHLTAVSIQLEKAQAYRERSPEEAEQAIVDARLSAQAALQDVRQSVAALRSPEEVFSLREALEDLVSRLDSDTLSVELHVDGDESGYARPALVALYRAAQEGLTNVQKHASAHHVILDVQLGDELARLNVRDDGDGFDTGDLGEFASSPDASFGLLGLQERVELVRGEIAIISDPERGTELVVTVPKNPAQLQLSGAA